MKRTYIPWLAVILLAITPAFAQAPANTARIHGHVQDPVAAPIAKAVIKLSLDLYGKNVKYTFTTDANGDYKGEGVEPGTYVATLFSAQGKALDQFTSVKLVANTDLAQDFDLTRPDYISKLTPEQRKAAEELRKQNAEAAKANAQVKNLNANLVQARAANKAKDYAKAEDLMKQATTLKPDAAVLWLELGIAQAGQKKYDDATTSLKKTLELDAASKSPSAELQGAANNTLGEVLANAGKVPDAAAAYEAASKADPKNSAMYYTNETIVLSRSGAPGESVAAAADKAIAADPTKPIPYYLKGQALIAKATIDPKTQKIVAPPGCAEAYQKYLELAPNGPMANDAKGVLAEMSETVTTSYKSGKKK